MRRPQLDATASAELRVTEGDLATAVALGPGDAFPPVLSTSKMVALMEVAAARILTPHLDSGEMSVGVAVDIVHTAATPLGSRVTADARLIAEEGKLFVFEVVAADEGGEIGRGQHKRAVVQASRLVAGAERRCPSR